MENLWKVALIVIGIMVVLAIVRMIPH